MGAVMFAGISRDELQDPHNPPPHAQGPFTISANNRLIYLCLLPLDVLFVWKFSNARSTQSFICSGSSIWKCTAILIRRMLLRLFCGLLMCFLESSYYLVRDIRERAAGDLHQDA